MDLDLTDEQQMLRDGARRFFREQGWPVIDVTKRSVEETAAEIMVLLQRRDEEQGEWT